MVILWYYNGIIIEGETTLLVFYLYIRSILKRARKIPHDQGKILVVWGNYSRGKCPKETFYIFVLPVNILQFFVVKHFSLFCPFVIDVSTINISVEFINCK